MGRETELGALKTALDNAVSGHGLLVLVAGLPWVAAIWEVVALVFKGLVARMTSPCQVFGPLLSRAGEYRPTPLAVNRHLPVIPSVQAIGSAKPNAAIPGRQDGPNNGTRQTLLDRYCGDGKVAKTVEAVGSGDPNIAFPIFKEPVNSIA